MQQMMPTMSEQDVQSVQALTSGPMLVVFNLIGSVVTALFGVVGGLIGGAIFRARPPKTAV
jgi:hypothetical protein